MKNVLINIYKTVARFCISVGIHKSPQLIAVRNMIFKVIKRDKIKIFGNTMYLDPGDAMLLSVWGVYERGTTELVKKEIKERDTILDIGANIGYYTLLFAKMAGPDGKVIAFEPEPKNFDLLSKNVTINGYSNVTLVQKAVSNETGEIDLCIFEDNPKAHRIFNPQHNRPSIKVDVVKLDDYFSNKEEKIDFIKLDVEGAELLALKGMSGLISRQKQVKLVTEFYPNCLKIAGVDPAEFLRFFTEHGFKIYNIYRSELAEVTADELIRNYPAKQGKLTNLFCVKG